LEIPEVAPDRRQRRRDDGLIERRKEHGKRNAEHDCADLRMREGRMHDLACKRQTARPCRRRAGLPQLPFEHLHLGRPRDQTGGAGAPYSTNPDVAPRKGRSSIASTHPNAATKNAAAATKTQRNTLASRAPPAPIASRSAPATPALDMPAS